MLTGIMIAILLGIHMVTVNLDVVLGFFGVDATEPRGWVSMIDRASQGIWVVLYIALLAVGLYHGLYGLRGIVLELTPSTRTKHIITWGFITIGIAVFIWGVYVPVALLAS